MRLAEMLNTSTSYIGEIEINRKIPSMEMVEKIAKALGVEPFRLFINDWGRYDTDTPLAENYLESLTTPERQDLSKRIIVRLSEVVERILHPENRAENILHEEAATQNAREI